MTTRVQGLTGLLFDRLVDNNRDVLEEDPQTYILTKAQHKASIVQQLTLLLNCRRTNKYLKQSDLDDLTNGPFQDYGLNDLMWLQISNEHNLNHLAQDIEKTIAKYEPRLTSIKVVIVGRNPKQTRLTIHIQASMCFNHEREQVHFPLILT